MRALDSFSNSKDFGTISRELGVQRATAEVYIIDAFADAFAAGKNVDPEHIAELLDVTKDLFSRLQQLLLTHECLGKVKEASGGCTYNQIRFVLACMIRDMHF